MKSSHSLSVAMHQEGELRASNGEPTTIVNTSGSGSNYGSTEDREAGREANTTLVPTTKTYLTRFWILFIVSSLGALHAVQWNTWGPISESMNKSFTGWGQSTVAIMANWGTIMFVVFVFPMCWAIQRYGLRAGVLSCTALVFIGSALRCITLDTPTFTIMCHLCAILLGISSTLILSAPIPVAAEWFPLHERTTAGAVMIGFCMMGCVGSYLEPLLVRQPGPHVSNHDIQEDVLLLLYIGMGVSGVLLLAVMVYFPAKPPTPPSVSISTERHKFIPGVVSLFKNKQFTALTIAYGFAIGPAVGWLTVLDFSLLPLGFHQKDAMWIGVTSVIAASVLPVIVGRINDLMHGHIRLLLCVLLAASAGCYYWFHLLSYEILPVTTWQVYMSVVGGNAFNAATFPLFFEVGIDLAYPVPEILSAGVMTAVDNIGTVMFLLVFFIPNVGYLWMTYTLVLSTFLAIVPLLFITFDDTRLIIDTPGES
ncbi:solute carrier family 49 member 4 homolog isoform X2 [Homarus americanus]|uniref:solute carrier family 49 member 4 homolog isoform X2 n=1 Tax=Homarus americanus TaxID=6706 RepID=UPI001C442E68|nr:solute carrier family 49 member 4 homolog isoform X2 [Homarus americanus]